MRESMFYFLWAWVSKGIDSHNSMDNESLNKWLFEKLFSAKGTIANRRGQCFLPQQSSNKKFDPEIDWVNFVKYEDN